MNRIALAFIIALLYMFALELPYHLILESRGFMYELKFCAMFFTLWITTSIIIHADKILLSLFESTERHTA
jgi:hypothetical protein